eukprot:1448876-Amphidinium_carterae.1
MTSFVQAYDIDVTTNQSGPYSNSDLSHIWSIGVLTANLRKAVCNNNSKRAETQSQRQTLV